MIQLYIKDQLVELEEGTSFTFTFENPYFTKCSNSTFDIYIPLKGSRNNLQIFGPLYRYDVTKQKISFPAKLYDKDRLMLDGTAIVNQVNEKGMKVQLVSGNSELNFRGNRDTYIDNLELDSVPMEFIGGRDWFDINITTHMAGPDIVKGIYMPVAVGDDITNRLYINVDAKGYRYLVHHPGGVALQPYLCAVIDSIVRAMGYTLRRNDILDTPFRYLYICSSEQGSKMQYALPHWTVCQFLDELEKFCSVVTVVDEIKKVVDFINTDEYYQDETYNYIDEKNIMHAYEVQITDKSSEKDVTTGNVSYALPGLTMNNFYSLTEGLSGNAGKKEYPNYSEMITAWKALSPEDKRRFIFVDQSTGKEYVNYHLFIEKEFDDNVLIEVDSMKMIQRREDRNPDVELKIVPACMKYTDMGVWDSKDIGLRYERKGPLFLLVPEVSSSRINNTEHINDYQKAIENNNIPNERHVKDIIEVAFNFGQYMQLTVGDKIYIVPSPFTDIEQVAAYQSSGIVGEGSLALDGRPDSIGQRILRIPSFHSDIAYHYKFLMFGHLDVKKKFLIGNQLYVCEKIELEVNADGMSNIAEGIFYKM